MWEKEEWLIFIVSFLVLAIFTKTGAASANDQSRMAAIQSIVEFRTFAIDQSQFVGTLDKVRINEHFYSDKLALSYLIGVPIYFILYHLGITFSEWPHLSYYLITLLTIGLSINTMFVYFFRLIERYGLNTKQKFFYVTSLALGTLVLPFSTVFNSHGLSAAFILLTFYFILNIKRTINYLFVGILAGLVASIEFVTGHIFLSLFLIFLFIRARFFKTSLFFIGALIPILLQLYINWHISGSVIPFYLRPEFFDYPGSAFGPGSSLSGGVTNSWSQALRFAFDLTIGSKAGFLYYTPILYFSLIGIAVAFFKRKYRLDGIMVFIGVLATLLFYMFKIDNYGGCAYGMRYTVSLIPILYSFTPLLFDFKDRKVTFLKLLFIMTLVVSIAFSFIGIINPWTCQEEFAIMQQPLKELLTQIFYNPFLFGRIF